MNSLPTIDQVNKENLIEVIKALDPELYKIKIALDETSVTPDIIPLIIRVIGNLNIGMGWGHIEVFMENRFITQIRAVELTRIKTPATIDRTDGKLYK